MILREPTIPPPERATRKPATVFPPGACDCHAHVFGPQTRYPFAPNAAYVAPDSTVEDYARLLQTLGCQRGVIVQPSVYGTDNSATVDALRSGLMAFRGVAVVRHDVSDGELQTLHDAGVRGIRVNIASATPGMTLEQAQVLAPRLQAMGWHIQFFLDLNTLTEAEARLGAFDLPIVIDHFGRVRAAEGPDGGACRTLLRLVSRPNVWTKLIGPYFLSTKPPHFPDVTPIAQAVVAAAPDRVVWGTDWPHPSAHGAMPNDGDLADLLATWVPDASQREKVLVDNPRRLYDFG